MSKDKNSICCNQECNQGRDCPVRNGTYKPAEALHEPVEPAAAPTSADEAHMRELTAYRTTVQNLEAELAALKAAQPVFSHIEARPVAGGYTGGPQRFVAVDTMGREMPGHLIAAAPAAVAVPSDDELRDKWRSAGGSFHGPVVETGTMPEEQLLPFLRALAATPAAGAPVVMPEPPSPIIEKLLALARLINTAVEDWGESFADGSSEVKFHRDVSAELESILDYFDNLPDGPDENVSESGPVKAARILRELLAGVSAPAAHALAIPDECPHLIWYDDQDRPKEMFAGHGAKAAATRRFAQISQQWNAHLFVRIEKNSRDCRYPVAAVAAPQVQAAGAAQAQEDSDAVLHLKALMVGLSKVLNHQLLGEFTRALGILETERAARRIQSCIDPVAQATELEALRDMLDSARTDLDMLREALGVPVEPHQTLSERLLEAAQADARDAWISVTDQLPEIHEWQEGSIAGISDLVLTCNAFDPDSLRAQYLRKGGCGDLTTLHWEDSPTHWMKAPAIAAQAAQGGA